MHTVCSTPGEATWSQLVPGCVCSKVKDMGPFSALGSEISENISLKMGVKFAASLNMGKNLC